MRHQASEILEPIPTIPRLQRLDGMLKNSAYDDTDEGLSDWDAEKLVHFPFVCFFGTSSQRVTEKIQPGGNTALYTGQRWRIA